MIVDGTKPASFVSMSSFRPLRLLAATQAAVTLAACAGGTSPASPSPEVLPATVTGYDGVSRSPLDTPHILQRLAAADFVLLGEVHDNPVQHQTRAAILRALAPRKPAVVFEQFAASDEAIPGPPAGTIDEGWLDDHGFDRSGWKWPLHRPVIEAALAHGRALWGSGLSRELLSGVIRGNAGALSPAIADLLARAPLDDAARALLDRELVDGHCGQLPASMVPGMRAAQTARDASMTRALLLASATGPAWLIAGNGHVRGDVAVPRILRRVAPDKSVVAVGLLEVEPDGSIPSASQWTGYDLVLVAPRTERPDPCATFRQRDR